MFDFLATNWYFMAGLLAYTFYCFVILTNYAYWERCCGYATPPMIVALLFAAVAALIWFISLPLVIPMAIYWRQLRKGTR